MTARYFIARKGKVKTVDLFDTIENKDARLCSITAPNIKITDFPNGYRLYTSLLAIDHSHSTSDYKAKPVIYETMLFDAKGAWSPLLSTVRYHHRFEAKQGHRIIRRLLSEQFKSHGKRKHIDRRVIGGCFL